MNTQEITTTNNSQLPGEILETIILENNLAGLKPVQKVEYVKSLCLSLGLNPATRPIQLLKFQGREQIYFTKDATEQLRKLYRVSITKLDGKEFNGVYTVFATAQLPDGRQDSSTGSMNVNGLKGEALSNAYMKAETKAKRRVTLSICGLGFMDESEIDSIPDAQRVELSETNNDEQQEKVEFEEEKLPLIIGAIKRCKNIPELQKRFSDYYREYGRQHPEHINKLVAAKDATKLALQTGGSIQ